MMDFDSDYDYNSDNNSAPTPCDSGSDSSSNDLEELVFALYPSNFYDTLLRHSHHILVVLFTYPGCKDFARKYAHAAKLLRSNNQISFAKVDLKKNEEYLAANCGVSSYPSIVIFRDGLREVHELDGPLRGAEWIVNCLLRLITGRDNEIETPAVTEYNVHTPERVADFFGDIDIIKAVLFIDRSDEGAPFLKEKYQKIAEKYIKQRVSFMLCDLASSEDAFRLLKLHKGGKAPFIVIQTAGGEHYLKDKLKSVDDIESFVEDYLAGKLSIPRKNVKVKEVVAQSFQKMVIDPGKNVFLEVGPWCQWCKDCTTLAQVLDDVAADYKNDDNVVIAKMYNDNAEIRHKGLLGVPHAVKDRPTLYFKRASGKKFTLYHGLRTVESITTFIKTNMDKVTGYQPFEIKSLEEGKNLIGDDKIVIVGVFPEFFGQAYDNFCEVASKLESQYLLFRTLDSQKLPDEECGPVVKLFKINKETSETKAFDVYALVEFVRDASLPVVICHKAHPAPFSERFFYSMRWYYKAMLFVNHEDAHIWMSKYEETAQKYRGKRMIFMLGDFKYSEDASQYFDLVPSEQPLFVIQNPIGDIYVKECLKSPDDIEVLVKDYRGFMKNNSVDDLMKFVENVAGSVDNDKAVFYINDNSKMLLDFKSKYESVAKINYGDINFIVPAIVEDPECYLEFDQSAIIIMNSNREIYVKQFLSPEDDIEGWVKDYKEGNVAKNKKSTRPSRLVAHVHSRNAFSDVVMKSGKNVLLVLFGSYWINAEKLNWVLNDVAFHFSKEKDTNVRIAMMSWERVGDYCYIRKSLSTVLDRLVTLSNYDKPTIYFMKYDNDINVYGGDTDFIKKEDIIEFIGSCLDPTSQAELVL